jgi:hypothetical protein
MIKIVLNFVQKYEPDKLTIKIFGKDKIIINFYKNHPTLLTIYNLFI